MCEARFALSSIARPRAISPPPRPGRDLSSACGRKLVFLDYAPWAATSFDDQLNSVPSTHMRCRMTASLRATATLALRRLLRLAIRIPQDLSADHFAMRVSSTLAASYR